MVKTKITMMDTKSAMGAAYKMPLMPVPAVSFSISCGSSSAKGVKHRIFNAMCKGEIDGFKLK